MSQANHHANWCRKLIAQRGVTLLETLISLSIGLIIIAGIGYAYLGTRQSFRTQDALSRMQEGARIAFELMDKDIRMAGFTSCATSAATAPTVTNILADPTKWYENLNYPLLGYENTSETGLVFTNAQYSSSFPTDPSGVAVEGVAGTVYLGDVLTVKHADQTQGFMVVSTSGHQVTLNAANPFVAGQELIGVNSTCTGIDLFKLTSCTGCTSNTFQYDNTNGTAANTVQGSNVYPLSAVTYYVCLPTSLAANLPVAAPNYYQCGNATEPALYRQILGANGTITAQELIEGVQDMQLSYAIDTNNDLAADCYANASALPFTAATGNCPAPTGTADWPNVIGVRISLLMVSRSSEAGITTKAQKYTLDRNGNGTVTDSGESATPANSPSDLLLRKVFTTTIAVKNRL